MGGNERNWSEFVAQCLADSTTMTFDLSESDHAEEGNLLQCNESESESFDRDSINGYSGKSNSFD